MKNEKETKEKGENDRVEVGSNLSFSVFLFHFKYNKCETNGIKRVK